jgi:hypothetical protein
MVLFFFYEFQFNENPDSKYLHIFITSPFFIFWILGGVQVYRAYLEITDDHIIYHEGFRKQIIKSSTITQVHLNPFLFLSPIGLDVGEKNKKVIFSIFESKKLYLGQLQEIARNNG